MRITICYFAIISLAAAIVFAHDKHAARKGKWRVPELTLHILELLGGVFAIVPMMYLIRHKNQKFSYYAWTYLILMAWAAALWLLFLKK